MSDERPAAPRPTAAGVPRDGTPGDRALGDRILRVGVTGHRDLAEPEEVADRVDRVLDDLLEHREDGTTLELLSSLAEGADRLVASRVLARAGGRLVAVLPFEAGTYRHDFLTSASRAEFDALLAAAEVVELTGTDATGTRTAAYERAGHRVVEGCEVLVALWDGEPARGRGGTAEIIDFARARGHRVVTVPARRRHLTTAEDPA